MANTKESIMDKDQALPGRTYPITPTEPHYIFNNLLTITPADKAIIHFGMGCFWGAERLFWQQDKVLSTAVGYSGGYTPNPNYDEVCTGNTAHTEVVRVICEQTVLYDMLKLFWENHDPTQGMRQGNDQGSQYRSAIYCTTKQQLDIALQTRDAFQSTLGSAPHNKITTEIELVTSFFFAETYHQQYLAKNPDGYCGLTATGFCLSGNQEQ